MRYAEKINKKVLPKMVLRNFEIREEGKNKEFKYAYATYFDKTTRTEKTFYCKVATQ